jgi:hypothetical protein
MYANLYFLLIVYRLNIIYLNKGFNIEISMANFFFILINVMSKANIHKKHCFILKFFITCLFSNFFQITIKSYLYWLNLARSCFFKPIIY